MRVLAICLLMVVTVERSGSDQLPRAAAVQQKLLAAQVPTKQFGVLLSELSASLNDQARLLTHEDNRQDIPAAKRAVEILDKAARELEEITK